jgi:hypothetical protein
MGAVWFVFFRTCQVSALLGTARGAIHAEKPLAIRGVAITFLAKGLFSSA